MHDLVRAVGEGDLDVGRQRELRQVCVDFCGGVGRRERGQRDAPRAKTRTNGPRASTDGGDWMRWAARATPCPLSTSPQGRCARVTGTGTRRARLLDGPLCTRARAARATILPTGPLSSCRRRRPTLLHAQLARRLLGLARRRRHRVLLLLLLDAEELDHRRRSRRGGPGGEAKLKLLPACVRLARWPADRSTDRTRSMRARVVRLGQYWGEPGRRGGRRRARARELKMPPCFRQGERCFCLVLNTPVVALLLTMMLPMWMQ